MRAFLLAVALAMFSLAAFGGPHAADLTSLLGLTGR